MKHLAGLRTGILVVSVLGIGALPMFAPAASSVSARGISRLATFAPPRVTFIAPFTQGVGAPTPMVTVEPANSPTPIVSIEEGSFYSPTYEKAECGSIDDVLCFELCYAGVCSVYGEDDARVARFIDKVNDREMGIRELEILRAERGGATFDALGTCIEAGAGAGLAYAAAVGLLAPEPTVSKILGGIAAVGAGIVCGGAVYNSWRVEGLKQELKIEEIIDDSQDAIAEFNDLQDNPP